MVFASEQGPPSARFTPTIPLQMPFLVRSCQIIDNLPYSFCKNVLISILGVNFNFFRNR